MAVNFTRQVELLANISIIVVALLLGGVLVKRYLFTDSAAPPNQPGKNQIVAGGKVDLKDVNWEENKHTLLLVLSEDCHFCTASLPFYQRVATEFDSSGSGVRLVAVFPQEVSAAQEYLKQHNVAVSSVVQGSPPKIGVGGTPSLLLVNRSGEVEETWLGKLSASQEKQVFERLHLAAKS